MSLEVPFHRPMLGTEEQQAVAAVLASGWLTSGASCAAFEERCGNYLGNPNVLATSSCTAALELALRLFEIGPGDSVITTPLTFVATAAVVWQVGAECVLVDVDPVTGILDPDAVEAAIDGRTRAIMPVHLAGHPAPMTRLLEICARHDLVLIDDAAHGFETVSDAGKVGAAGHATAFSFYANKNLTTGEGGLLALSDPRLLARARRLRLHGIDRDAYDRRVGAGFRFYDVAEIGLKANLPDTAAAVGLAQLDRLEQMTARRQEIVARYDDALSTIPSVSVPPRPQTGHAWHIYPLELRRDEEGERDRVIDGLFQRGVGASVHFKPLHLLSGPATRFGSSVTSLPRAEAYYRTHLSLPLFPAMTDEDVECVMQAVADVCS